MFVSNITMFPFLWLMMSFLVIHFKMCDTTVGAYETIEKIKIIIIIIIIIINHDNESTVETRYNEG